MTAKTSVLTSDLTLMYAHGYGAARRFTNTRVPRSCGHGGSDRQCGGEVPGDRQDGALAGPTSEEMAVGRRNPGAAFAAPASCCAPPACRGARHEFAVGVDADGGDVLSEKEPGR